MGFQLGQVRVWCTKVIQSFIIFISFSWFELVMMKFNFYVIQASAALVEKFPFTDVKDNQ